LSSNIVKGSFIRFTGENTRVIDSQDLVKKRMDDFSGVLRERSNPEQPVETGQDVYGILNDPIDELTGDIEGGFKEISFGSSAEHVSVTDTEIEQETSVQPDAITLNSDEVRAECEAMIAKANQKAEEIRLAAKEEAEQIKASARQEGINEGIEEGRRLGLSEYDSKLAELETEKEQIYAQYSQTLSELEPKMVDTIASIYEYVFGSGLYNRRDVIVHLLNRALTTVSADEGIFIFVSPKDYDGVFEQREEVISKTALREVPDIRMRNDLAEGQAIIETPYGILDCSIDTELTELQKTLKLLSFERRG